MPSETPFFIGNMPSETYKMTQKFLIFTVSYGGIMTWSVTVTTS